MQDSPAWIVSKANQYARDHGKTPFSVYQGQWSLMQRSFERDIIPMARAEGKKLFGPIRFNNFQTCIAGLALTPWGVLSEGRLRTDAEDKMRRETGELGRTYRGQTWERSEEEKKMSAALEVVAEEVGATSIQAGAYFCQLILNSE